MTEEDVARLGRILAVYAEVEGMKAENAECRILERRPIHEKDDFQTKANELLNIVYEPR